MPSSKTRLDKLLSSLGYCSRKEVALLLKEGIITHTEGLSLKSDTKVFHETIRYEGEPLDPPQDVKVAYVPIMKFATMYVAAERGLFEKYGLNVSFERVKSGTEAIAFLTQGSVDVGGIAIVTSLWNSWNRGLDVRAVALMGAQISAIAACCGLLCQIAALFCDSTRSAITAARCDAVGGR